MAEVYKELARDPLSSVIAEPGLHTTVLTEPPERLLVAHVALGEPSPVTRHLSLRSLLWPFPQVHRHLA